MTSTIQNLTGIPNYMIGQNGIYQIIWAIILFVILYFVLKRVIKFVDAKLEAFTKWKKTNFWIILLNFVKNTREYFFLVLEVYIPLKTLTLNPVIDQILNAILVVAVVLQIIRLSNNLLVYVLNNVFKKQVEINKTSQNAIQLTVKVLVWVIWTLLILTNLWVEVTPLVASLWIWWIAIAFAFQRILEDLFSSFSILTSKPFGVWDYIISGDVGGTVTNITLKSTYLSAITWEKVILPNSDVLKNKISNYGEMAYRRKRFKIWVIYETWIKKLKKIPSIIEKVIDKQEWADLEWIHLKDLGDFSINFEISYKMDDTDFIHSLDTHWKIIYNLLESFEKEWVSIAYPTQVIHVEK